MKTFPEIKKNFGFGMMRLPSNEGEIDIKHVCEMVDRFIDAGFNYFDTAHGYHRGKSELAVKDSVSSRYPREKFLLTNKLTGSYFKSTEDIRPFFESQLKSCGVDYFDFYLMHAQTQEEYDRFVSLRAYEEALKFLEEGKIRHFGISFHDRAPVLEKILTDYPEIEIVQIQLNYADWEDDSVDSRRIYEVCEKFDKPCIIMEPVKGGSLVKLPDEAQACLDTLGGKYSNAGYAIRFAADLKNVAMVLSGMSNNEQMEDNIRTMKDFEPLSDTERKTLSDVVKILHSNDSIPCTGCRYCIDENTCPMDILIPDVFAAYNANKIFHSWTQSYYYNDVLTKKHGKASDCIGCGGCERVCPQKIKITSELKTVAEHFEKEE